MSNKIKSKWHPSSTIRLYGNDIKIDFPVEESPEFKSNQIDLSEQVYTQPKLYTDEVRYVYLNRPSQVVRKKNPKPEEGNEAEGGEEEESSGPSTKKKRSQFALFGDFDETHKQVRKMFGME